jgi:hypothetical protein
MKTFGIVGEENKKSTRMAVFVNKINNPAT